MNGHLITSVNIREKKLLKPKKKRKAQCSNKEVPKDLLSVEKDKLQEEEGVWQTKISSREKRHLRKERLKQKGKCTGSVHTPDLAGFVTPPYTPASFCLLYLSFGSKIRALTEAIYLRKYSFGSFYLGACLLFHALTKTHSITHRTLKADVC